MKQEQNKLTLSQRASIVPILFCTLLLLPLQSLLASTRCQDSLSAKPVLSIAISRDLETDAWVNSLQEKYKVSAGTTQYLKDAFFDPQTIDHRKQIVQYFLANPQVVESTQKALEQIRANPMLTSDDKSQTDLKTKIEKMKTLYTIISPVALVIAPVLGGLPAGLAVFALNSKINDKPPVPSSIKMIGGFLLKKAGEKIKEKAATVLSEEELSQFNELAACTTGLCLEAAEQIQNNLIPKGQEYIEQLASQLKQKLTELEFGYVMASEINSWKKRGIPVTEVSTVADSSANDLHLEDAYHPLLLQSEIPFTPINLDTTSDKSKIVLITGQNGAGKSVLLSTLGWYSMMARLGIPVPAAKAVIPNHLLLTSLKPTDSQAEGESLFDAEMRKLKEINVAAKENPDLKIILLDEPLRGTHEAKRAQLIQHFVNAATEKNALVLLTTHSDTVIEKLLPLKPMTIRVDKQADGQRSMKPGVFRHDNSNLSNLENPFEN